MYWGTVDHCTATDADAADTVSYTQVMMLVVCSRLTLMALSVWRLQALITRLLLHTASKQATSKMARLPIHIYDICDDPDEHDLSAISTLMALPMRFQRMYRGISWITHQPLMLMRQHNYYELSNDAGLFKINGDGEVTVNAYWIMRPPPVMTSLFLPRALTAAFQQRVLRYLLLMIRMSMTYLIFRTPIFLQIRFRRTHQ